MRLRAKPISGYPPEVRRPATCPSARMPGRQRQLLEEYPACIRCGRKLELLAACECGFHCRIAELRARGEQFPDWLTAVRPAGVWYRERGRDWSLTVLPLSVEMIPGFFIALAAALALILRPMPLSGQTTSNLAAALVTNRPNMSSGPSCGNSFTFEIFL
jgi:hypothetical protein